MGFLMLKNRSQYTAVQARLGINEFCIAPLLKSMADLAEDADVQISGIRCLERAATNGMHGHKFDVLFSNLCWLLQRTIMCLW
jgi:hypothetical protein